MDSLKEFQEKYSFAEKVCDEFVFCQLKNLKHIAKRIDFDVYLPTIGKKLQREYVWTHYQSTELIFSILVDRKIPPICYVSKINPEGGQDTIQIIDGKQRLISILKFVNHEFRISICGELFLYGDLPKDFKEKIDAFTIKCVVMYETYDSKNSIVEISDTTKIKWFSLINFTATQQDENHLKNLLSL